MQTVSLSGAGCLYMWDSGVNVFCCWCKCCSCTYWACYVLCTVLYTALSM